MTSLVTTRIERLQRSICLDVAGAIDVEVTVALKGEMTRATLTLVPDSTYGFIPRGKAPAYWIRGPLLPRLRRLAPAALSKALADLANAGAAACVTRRVPVEAYTHLVAQDDAEYPPAILARLQRHLDEHQGPYLKLTVRPAGDSERAGTYRVAKDGLLRSLGDEPPLDVVLLFEDALAHAWEEAS
jgi:hypothetical protein